MGQVSNVIEEEVPGTGTVRLSMDFGDLKELIDGAALTSCAVAVNSGALTPLTASAITVDTAYSASALFTGGGPGTYAVAWTPTITLADNTTQTLPPRTATLTLS